MNPHGGFQSITMMLETPLIRGRVPGVLTRAL
jgi:hypothetical protein